MAEALNWLISVPGNRVGLCCAVRLVFAKQVCSGVQAGEDLGTLLCP